MASGTANASVRRDTGFEKQGLAQRNTQGREFRIFQGGRSRQWFEQHIGFGDQGLISIV